MTSLAARATEPVTAGRTLAVRAAVAGEDYRPTGSRTDRRGHRSRSLESDAGSARGDRPGWRARRPRRRSVEQLGLDGLVHPQHHDRRRGRSSSWEICAASMLTSASPSSVPTVPMTPGPVGVRQDQQVALGAQVEVPAVDLDQLRHLLAGRTACRTPSARRRRRIAARSVHRRCGSRRSPRSRCSVSVSPCSAASTGALTKVTASVTTSPKMPAHRGELQDRDVLGGELAAHLDLHLAGHAAGDRGEDACRAGRPAGSTAAPRRDTGPAACTFTASGTKSPRSASLHRAGDGGAGLVLRLGGGGAQVRGDAPCSGQLEQRAGRWQRLGDVDVDAGAARPGRRRSASASACSSISPPRAALTMMHARLDRRELVRADQAQRLGGLRQVDGDDVGGRPAASAGRPAATPSAAARAGCRYGS